MIIVATNNQLCTKFNKAKKIVETMTDKINCHKGVKLDSL